MLCWADGDPGDCGTPPPPEVATVVLNQISSSRHLPRTSDSDLKTLQCGWCKHTTLQIGLNTQRLTQQNYPNQV